MRSPKDLEIPGSVCFTIFIRSNLRTPAKVRRKILRLIALYLNRPLGSSRLVSSVTFPFNRSNRIEFYFLVPVATRPGAPPTRKRGKLARQPSGPARLLTIRHAHSPICTETALRQRRYGTALRTRFYGNGYGNGYG